MATWARFWQLPDGEWMFRGFTSSEENVTEFMEVTKAAGGIPVCIDLDTYAPVSFTCPRCDMTTRSANDIGQGYCSNCHDWTGLHQAARTQLPHGGKSIREADHTDGP